MILLDGMAICKGELSLQHIYPELPHKKQSSILTLKQLNIPFL